MAAPKFSVGVDADPMLVEQRIDKTLDEIIKERRMEIKGESLQYRYGVRHRRALLSAIYGSVDINFVVLYAHAHCTLLGKEEGGSK